MDNNSTTTTIFPGIDTGVIKVMKAIRQIESGGNYNVSDPGGDAHGAFQYDERTGPGWKNVAKQYLGDENAPMDKANQNKATYYRIKEWKDKGLQPDEIAARWNGAHVDQNTGKYTYNNPDYGVKFRNALKNHSISTTKNNFVSNQQIDAPQAEPEQSLGSKVGGFLKDLASPVATMIARVPQAGAALAGVSNEDIDKWTADNMKTVGLDGLIAPTPKNFSDLPKDVGRGIETASFGTKSLVKGGALLGLGSSMEQGNPVLSGETALNVGLGAAGGKALGIAGKVLSPIASSVLTKTGLMPEGMAERAYNTAKGKFVKAQMDQVPFTPTQKINEANRLDKMGANAYTTTAEHGITLGSPEADSQLQEISNHYANGLAEAQKYEKARFSLPDLQKEIQKGIDERFQSQELRDRASTQIQKEIDSLLKANPKMLHPDNTVGGDFMERLRKIGNEMTPFNASDDRRIMQSTGYTLSDAVRNQVEKHGTFSDYRDANREWSHIIHAQEMNNKLIDSGKEYRKMGGLSGSIMQKVLSGAFGYHTGGIGGAILAEMGTDVASKVISNPKYRTYLSRQIIKNFHNSNPSKSALAKLAKQVEEHIQKEEVAKTTRLALPAGNKEHVQGVVPTLVKKTQVESPAKTIRQYPESREAKVQALKNKQEYQPQTYTPEQEHFKEAEHKVITQMSDLSQAGYRKPNADGSFSGVESTFPKWVPEHLRQTKYFKQAIRAYESGEYPRSSKANELLALIKRKIEKEARNNAEVASYEAIAREKGL